MRDLEALVTDKSFIGQQFAVGNHVYSVAKTDCFEYVDPVDGTVTKKQVLARKSPERAKARGQSVRQLERSVGLIYSECFVRQVTACSQERKKPLVKVTYH